MKLKYIPIAIMSNILFIGLLTPTTVNQLWAAIAIAVFMDLFAIALFVAFENKVK